MNEPNAVDQTRVSLDAIFLPRSVAVIGATENAGSVGRTIFENLRATPFGGPIYPVNPKRETVLGEKAYPSISAIGAPVDLAVIAIPATRVPTAISECVQAGVTGAIIISAGFRETGPAGAELERQIAEASRGKMRIIGPNCLGVMNPITGLNATFAAGVAKPGSVGFISQSGALCTAILDWSLRENAGFSAFVSAGAMLDVNWGDLIRYLGRDPKTRSIVIYMESIGDARSFLSAAREVANRKPIIVIKAGRSGAAAKAASSHTGSLAGSDEVLDAAFRRCGVLRVNTIAKLFYMAEVLSNQPGPKGPRLTILTNAGGPGVLATDSLIECGGTLAELAPETIERLNSYLPSHWSHGNPIDVLGDSDPERFARAFQIALEDNGTDGVLAIITPQAMTDPTRFAAAIAPLAKQSKKPVLASWMGGHSVQAGIQILQGAGIPSLPYPDTATRIFQYMAQYSANLERLMQAPELPGDAQYGAPDRKAVQGILGEVLSGGRTLLTELESKNLLSAYRIPTVPTQFAASANDAVRLAESLHYPVVLKLHSQTITHKTDVGGVKLNLKNDADVLRAFREIKEAADAQGSGHFLGVTVQPMIDVKGCEVILGSSIDEQFGPVLLFGWGGEFVEVLRDRTLCLPPVNEVLARQAIERTKVFNVLKGARGRKAVNFDKLERIIVRFSQLICEQPRIKEIDINPLLAASTDVVALDARVVLHDKSIPDKSLPRPALL
jgi:acetyltransferase